MADDAASKPPSADTIPVLGTMQMPRGDVVGSAPLMPTLMPEAAPLMPTLMPEAATPMPELAPPPMPPDARYELGVEIARGGMGRVVEATDTLLGRVVALKEALSRDPEAVRRFQRETRITARLEHPSIVPVHDAGTSSNGAPFYVMRKISGRPLENLVGIKPELAPRLALLPHIVAAAAAVAHAHARGIVHRDIKPANILVGDLGETILIDWGLAKAIDEADEHSETAPLIEDDTVHTRAGIVFGTPGFMSPEQLRGAPVDERCDVYALGATLYHLLARMPPHHAKTADEMMRAAVNGAPTGLRDMVPGVPPELATIVDKALAHDPATRYQDAGALAEELQRFLTGQLVASHHYSSRERLVRFVRKHRAIVGVTVAALVAMVIGGWLAISRIVDARDRADAQARIALSEKQVAEQQRERVIDSLQQLTLTDARTKAIDDPTRAVAMVKPLVVSKWWRQARDVAAASRATGVAFSLPASPHTLSLEMSRDGSRALAAGDDGIVRIHDLAHRTSQTVATLNGPVTARFGDGEHTIVVWHGNHVTLIDAATGGHRDFATPTEVVKLEVSGPIAYWVDPSSAVWKLDLAGGTPSRVALDEPIKAVVPSPDGRWIALAGNAHLLLLDRTSSTLPPEAVADGDVRDLEWAADASHLVGLLGDEVVDVDMMPAPKLFNRQTVGNRYAVAYCGGHIFSAGPTGVALVTRDETRVRKIAGDFALGLREARGGIVIGAGAHGMIAVMSDDGDQLLRSPLAKISRIEASPRASWLLAASDGVVLAWDLSVIEPRHVTQSAPTGVGFVTGDQLVVTFVDGPAQWIDLRTDKTSSLGMIPSVTAVVAAPDGQRAVVIDGTHHARIVAAVGDPIDLEDDVDAAAFVDDRRLVLARQGALVLDEASQPRHVLVQRPSRVVALAADAANGGWIGAAFAERILWRTNLGSRSETTLDVSALPSRAGFALAPDGTIVFASGAELHAWLPDGTATTLATFGKPIATVALVTPATAFVLTIDGNAHLVGTHHGAEIDQTLPMTTAVSLAADAALIAEVDASGALEVIDPVAKERWTLASSKTQAFGYTQISADAKRVLAVTPAGLLVWTLALPATAAETAPWLDTLTNAIAERGPSAPLDWR